MAEREGVRFGIKSERAGATSAVAVSLMRNITQTDKDDALEQAVRGLIGDARRSAPNSYPGGGAPGRDAGAMPRSGGGGGTRPIEMPGGASAQRAIERMCDAALPHGAGNPEFRGAIPQAALRKAVAAARAVLAEEAVRAAAPAQVSAVAEPVAVAQEPEPVLAAAEPVAVVARAQAGTLTRRRLA